MQEKWGMFWLTNFVTLLRVIGIFLLIPVYKSYGGLATFILSALCFLTDLIDGLMARKFKCSSFFGSIFDAVSDKAFLIINMLLLMSITPFAIIPIIIEVSIALVQSFKYQQNIVVQSSIFGKAKMWVAGITISLSYLLVDSEFISSLIPKLGNIINSTNKDVIFFIVLLPFILIGVITLIDYIKEYFVKKNKITPEKIKEKEKLDMHLAKEIKNVDLVYALFDHKFYEKYKDRGNLKFLMDLTKKYQKQTAK